MVISHTLKYSSGSNFLNLGYLALPLTPIFALCLKCLEGWAGQLKADTAKIFKLM